MSVEGWRGRLDEAASEAPAALIRTLLAFLRRRLDLDVALVASFQDGIYVIDEVDGDPDVWEDLPDRELSVSDSYCVRVIDGRLPAVIPDTSRNQTTAALPITAALGIGSYIGATSTGPTATRSG